MSFGVSSKGQENAGLKLGHVMGQGVEITADRSSTRALRARVGGAPLLSKSTHPRKFGNHVTLQRPNARRPSAPQETQCLLSHF